MTHLHTVPPMDTAAACVHHWRFPDQGEPNSHVGICKRCGAERAFLNTERGFGNPAPKGNGAIVLQPRPQARVQGRFGPSLTIECRGKQDA